MPASSLVLTPAYLTIHLHSLPQRSPTTQRPYLVGYIERLALYYYPTKNGLCIRSFGTMFSSVKLSAHDYLTSELLRTLSRNGCF